MMRPGLPLLLLYAGTGLTALAYEVLWTRMLSLMFGVSIFGVVITVTAFMAGLGGGSLAAAGKRLSARRALAWLARLEAAIALYALLLPLMMSRLDQMLVEAGSALPLAAWQGVQGGAALLLLLLPALAMGAAFPLALRAAASLRVGLGPMYGVNAIGGAVGAGLPLLLLPWLGWRDALWLVAAVGLVLAIGAWLLSRRLDEGQLPAAHRSQRPGSIDLLAYAGVGAAALMLEMEWTRIYGMVLLRTEYILAVLLIVYLAGIGFGSVLARFMLSAWWLRLLPVAASALAVAGMYLLPAVSGWAHDAQFSSLASAMLWQGLAVAAFTLPVTLALGAWLPLLARGHDDQAVAGGWWYGANSFGAAAGALLGGFVLLPQLGAAGSLALAAVLLFICGMRWVADRRVWLLLPLLLLLIWPVHTLPPASKLLPAIAGARDLSLYEDAVSLTHVVEQPGGQRLLLSDLQRMDASSEPTAVTVQKNQARLPLLLHPHPHSILFLGVGTGITAAGSLPFGELQRTGVELSAGAIRAAATAFAPVNGGIVGRMHIVHDDARRFLRSDRHHYDVIVGDLFHPDMVGRANLLSVQQFRRARARLNDGGLFVQWLALNQFDVASLKVVMHTFRSVFDHAALFVDGYRIALVGVNGGQVSAAAALAHWAQLSAAQQQAASGGEGIWTWLGRYWGDIPQFDGALQDEWAPVIEYALPRVRYAGGVDVAANWQWLLSWRQRADAAAARLAVPKPDMPVFRRAWVGSEADVQAWLAELAGDDGHAVYWAQLAHRANPDDRWAGFALADRMFESLAQGVPHGFSREQALQKILAIRPDHEGALRALMQLAEQKGEDAKAALLRQKLQKLSPLARQPGKE